MRKKGTRTRRHERTKGEPNRDREGAESAKNRMLGPSEPVAGVAPPQQAGLPAKQHWSACPNCGASKLSLPPVNTPICTHTGFRIENGIQRHMRCRECDTPYTVVAPD